MGPEILKGVKSGEMDALWPIQSGLILFPAFAPLREPLPVPAILSGFSTSAPLP